MDVICKKCGGEVYKQKGKKFRLEINNSNLISKAPKGTSIKARMVVLFSKQKLFWYTPRLFSEQKAVCDNCKRNVRIPDEVKFHYIPQAIA
jgi:hypothetical protein